MSTRTATNNHLSSPQLRAVSLADGASTGAVETTSSTNSDDVSSEVSVMLLQPLTTQDKRAVMELVNSYAHFWTNPRFQEGFINPPFTRAEVEDLLEQAAEYVVRIRNHLDAKALQSGKRSSKRKQRKKMHARLLMGSAEEFLWSLDFAPQQDPRRFVVGLVHATFQDQAGYVEGLSQEIVDEYIAEIDEYYGLLPAHHHRNPKRCRRELQTTSDSTHPAQTQPLIASAASRKVPPPIDTMPSDNAQQPTNWSKSVGEMLSQAKDYLEMIPEKTAQADEHTGQWINVCKMLDSVNNQLASMCGLNINHAEPLTPTTTASLRNSLGLEPTSMEHGKKRKGARKAIAKQQDKKQQLTPRKTKWVNGSAPTAPDATVSDAIGADDAKMDIEENQPEDQKANDVKANGKIEESASETTMEVDEPPKPSEVDIQVGRVCQNVEKVQGDVQSLLNECHNLNLDALLHRGGEGDNGNNAPQLSPEIVSKLSDKVVEQLQKKALGTSETLMSDLLKLDQLVCANPEEREKRRQAVKTIQSVLDDVDRVAERLRRLQQTLAEEKRRGEEAEQARQAQLAKEREERERKEREEAKLKQEQEQKLKQAQALAAKAPTASASTAAVRSVSPAKPSQVPATPPEEASPKQRPQTRPSPETSNEPAPDQRTALLQALKAKLAHIQEMILTEDSWRTLKLEPKFTVTQQRNRFVIQAYIPSMRREDISVDLSEDGDVLIIKGFRMPSKAELKQLLGQLEYGLSTGQLSMEKFLSLSDSQILTSLGGGRFGSFTQQYRLPEQAGTVLRDQIQATYTNGALSVVVPIEEERKLFSYPFGAHDEENEGFGFHPPTRAPMGRGGFYGNPLFNDFFPSW